jgi:hypothetical protein
MAPILPEGRHGTPSADLHADPDWWHSHDDHAAEYEVAGLLTGLVTGLQPELVVEIGTYKGYTTQWLGLAVQGNAHGLVVGIEVVVELAEATAERCNGLPVRIIARDYQTVRLPGPVDFAWIDQAEPIDHLAAVHWIAPQMSPRGLIAVHDTGTQFPLRGPLLEWAAGYGWDCLLLSTPRGMGLLRREVTDILGRANDEKDTI